MSSKKGSRAPRPRGKCPICRDFFGLPVLADWVAASATHNWVIGDPLADYLDEYGKQAGFNADHDMVGYENPFDYVSFVLKRSWLFQSKVTEWLSSRHPLRVIVTNPAQARLPEKV